MSNKMLVIIIVILIAVLGVMVWKITRPKKEALMQDTNIQQNTVSSEPANSQQNVIGQANNNAVQPQAAVNQEPPNFKEIKDTGSLQAIVLTEGTGATVVAGDTVAVHYTGWLTSGTKFDSSLDRGQPFSFQVGTGSVIAGWDQGVVGMKVGEKRRLVIPSELGYGAAGAGASIPPNSTLVFDVQLLGIQGK